MPAIPPEWRPDAAGRASLLTGVNGEAIWQWAFIERVSSGLFLFRLGHRQEARHYLAVADRLSGMCYSTQ